jgi:5-methylthioadenosine/S-adenosylhomocysteine deaminase
MVDLLISSCDVMTFDGLRHVIIPDQDIAITRQFITDILPSGAMERGNAREHIDGSNLLAIPGLINSHAHVPMVLFRGLAEDVSIDAWFNDYVFPLESNLEPEDVYWGALLGSAEMIRAGITTFADHYFYCDEIAQAVQQSGMRANLGWAVFGHEGEGKLSQTVDFVKRWQGKAEGRITTWLAPHAPYTCDPAFLSLVARRAKELNVGIHIHCSETHAQVMQSLEQYDLTPPAMLQQAGVLDVPTLLAHCVGATTEDIALLKGHDVAIAQCPKTYMKLAMGTAPVREFRAAGLKVGLGTDGAVSSNTLDILEQMRLLCLDQKQAAKSSTAFPIQEALDIAFRGGAQALRLHNAGSLAVGNLADIALLRQDGAHMFPRHDALANLVYSAQASDVDTVLCNGKLLMLRGRLLTIDLPRVQAEISMRLRRLNQRSTAADKRVASYPA